MNEFQPRIEEWRERLAVWQRRFDDEYASLARRRKGLFRSLSTAEQHELADAARLSVGEQVPVELHAFLVELVDAYLAEKLPAQRAKTRAWIGATGEMLNSTWSFAEQLLANVQDERGLRRALAALSIHDLRGDYNAVVEQLGRAWLAASKAGLDPAPHFAALAALSNPGMGGGGACLGALLAEFSRSAYFRANVKPLLGRASA